MSRSLKWQMIFSLQTVHSGATTNVTVFLVQKLRPAQRVRTTSCMAMGYSTSGKINPPKGFFSLPDPAVPAGDYECEQEEAHYSVKEYCVQKEQLGVAGAAGVLLHTRGSATVGMLVDGIFVAQASACGSYFPLTIC
ncbi:hypothetical protein F5051DRAFT_451329 [Lentinula edodes]|nr:hypothetical protein F5051DRAFT_451329 [Lentinula edodes]KAJ3922047.1 hypothetical protein F5877DRAFT_75603 [Lentinula edodes]